MQGTGNGKSEPRSLSTIAAEIRADLGSKRLPTAEPYLDAMGELNKITDRFYEDSAKSVVLYFLSNAAAWRGDVARRVRAELRAMVA